jgi:hypothetical protein
VARYPGAYAAALVDNEGETVDYAGDADSFDIKVTAAHWSIILARVGEGETLGHARSLIVRGSQRSFVVTALPDGYALVILLRRLAGFATSRALAACTHALAVEAGWRLPLRGSLPWFPVLVTCDRPHHPSGVTPLAEARHTARANARAVEVIGTVVGLGPRERGYRVRLEDGAELTLVREPGDFWYADERVDPG